MKAENAWYPPWFGWAGGWGLGGWAGGLAGLEAGGMGAGMGLSLSPILPSSPPLIFPHLSLSIVSLFSPSLFPRE